MEYIVVIQTDGAEQAFEFDSRQESFKAARRAASSRMIDKVEVYRVNPQTDSCRRIFQCIND